MNILALIFFLTLFGSGVYFHGRDALKREPGALFAAILSGSLLGATLAAAF